MPRPMVIVQKFGGTSVGNSERLRNVADIVGATRADSEVIAVVSAMSGTTKAEGTTSLLLAAADAAVARRGFAVELGQILKAHEAATLAIDDAAARDAARAFVTEELERLRAFLDAISVIRELSPRSRDVIPATGERLSARVLAGVLAGRGVPSRFVDLSSVVPEAERDVDPAFFRRLQASLASSCKPTAGEVPVVTGFFGMVPGGLLAAVGRGYTDFTAAMIAAGLGNAVARELQVWKEVDGIFTSDPRKVPAARVLPRMSPAEAAELTYFGSEVLHPFTMERVVTASVPIRLKNTFRPSGAGTIIAPYD